MVNADSGSPKNTPAPWVPYTRAGCDFGAVSRANIVLENTGTGPNGDMTKVFGRARRSGRGPGFERGAGRHAAVLWRRPTSSASRALRPRRRRVRGQPQRQARWLPDEPGGYAGFKGLFGAKSVNPAITGGSPW